MKLYSPFIASALLSLLILAIYVSIIEISAQEDTSTRLKEAFEVLRRAEDGGGDVKELVDLLNEALSLLEESEKNGDDEVRKTALSKIEEVISGATKIVDERPMAEQTRVVITGITLGALTTSFIAVWRYLPRFFWRIWIKTKRGWKVKAR